MVQTCGSYYISAQGRHYVGYIVLASAPRTLATASKRLHKMKKFSEKALLHRGAWVRQRKSVGVQQERA